jgi:hypothetical protein
VISDRRINRDNDSFEPGDTQGYLPLRNKSYERYVFLIIILSRILPLSPVKRVLLIVNICDVYSYLVSLISSINAASVVSRSQSYPLSQPGVLGPKTRITIGNKVIAPDGFERS